MGPPHLLVAVPDRYQRQGLLDVAVTCWVCGMRLHATLQGVPGEWNGIGLQWWTHCDTQWRDWPRWVEDEPVVVSA
jgi:hypothetical protein